MGTAVRALLGLLLALAGCSRELPLLDVTGLESSQLESGEPLELVGRGFPAGRTGELVLRGRLLGPGQASDARRVSVTLPAEARSSDRARVSLESVALEGWGEGARFEGALELRFSAHEGSGLGRAWVSGVLEHASFEVVRDRRALAREGPAAEAREVVDANSRSGRFAPGELLRLDDLRWLLWMCPVALSLVFLGPWRSPSEVLRLAIERVRAAPLVMFARAQGDSSAVTFVLSAVAAAAGSVGAWVSPGMTPSLLLLAYVTLLVLLVRTRSRWLVVAGYAAAISFALSCVVILSGAASLAALTVDQGPWPWQWNLLARPPLWAAGWLVFHCGAWLHERDAASRSRAMLDNVARVLLAGLVATTLLGGAGPSTLPGLGSWPAPVQIGLGSAVLLVKLYAVLLALALVRATLPPLRLRAVFAGMVLLATMVTIWLLVAPARTFELRIGTAVAVTGLLSLGLAVAEYFLLHRRTRDPQLTGSHLGSDSTRSML